MKFPRTRILFPALILLTVSLIVLLTLPLIEGPAARNTHAQSGDCDDPFEGQRVSFNPAYWDLTDFCQHSVSYAEIFSGGPAPNGIPPLDDPQFESLDDARDWLVDRSPVIALHVDGDARAYPLAILMWHEIANDTVGGVPVAVTFCPLCNASIVFDRRVDGDVLTFGTTGNLRGSDLVMWDDVTQSWWQQFTGEAIVGSYTGTLLTKLPSQVVGFGAFAEQYPDGQVLSVPEDFSRPYGDNPYAFYDTEVRSTAHRSTGRAMSARRRCFSARWTIKRSRFIWTRMAHSVITTRTAHGMPSGPPSRVS